MYINLIRNEYLSGRHDRMNVNLIRDEYPDGRHELTAQLPMYILDINMNELAAPLIAELDGQRGLHYTACFDWKHYERVKAYFENLGYETTFVDAREEGREVAARLRASARLHSDDK